MLTISSRPLASLAARVAFALCLATAGCGGNPTSDLQGAWRGTGESGTVVLSFYEKEYFYADLSGGTHCFRIYKGAGTLAMVQRGFYSVSERDGKTYLDQTVTWPWDQRGQYANEILSRDSGTLVLESSTNPAGLSLAKTDEAGFAPSGPGEAVGYRALIRYQPSTAEMGVAPEDLQSWGLYYYDGTARWLTKWPDASGLPGFEGTDGTYPSFLALDGSDVYAVGNRGFDVADSRGSVAALWKNGVPVALDDPAPGYTSVKNLLVTGLAVGGGNAYTVGMFSYSYAAGTKPPEWSASGDFVKGGYWKNTAWNDLTVHDEQGNALRTMVRAAAFANGHFYAAGEYVDASWGFHGCVWTDGVRSDLAVPDDPVWKRAHVTHLDVDGGVVRVTGYRETEDGNGSAAVLWEDGQYRLLSDPTTGQAPAGSGGKYSAGSVALAGGSAFVVGHGPSQSAGADDANAVFWLNGAPTLPDFSPLHGPGCLGTYSDSEVQYRGGRLYLSAWDTISFAPGAKSVTPYLARLDPAAPATVEVSRLWDMLPAAGSQPVLYAWTLK